MVKLQRSGLVSFKLKCEVVNLLNAIGSSLHCIEALKHPRFEDFQYTYFDDDEFGWFGQGLSERDISDTLDKSYYLTKDQIDVAL